MASKGKTKVKFLQAIAGATIFAKKGDVLELQAKLAKQLIAAEVCVECKEETPIK